MHSRNNFEANGLPGAAPQDQPSAFPSQASTLAQQDTGTGAAASGANVEEGPTTSSGSSSMQHDNGPSEDLDPMEALPLKDWEELENRYEQEMEAAIQNEQSIIDEIEWVMSVCTY
jgi:hypothetical protein